MLIAQNELETRMRGVESALARHQRRTLDHGHARDIRKLESHEQQGLSAGERKRCARQLAKRLRRFRSIVSTGGSRMSEGTTRKKLVKALQTGRHKLGMTDAEYRTLLMSVSGGRTESSKELTTTELQTALSRLRNRGFAPSTPPQYAKIAALWLSMHREGIVKDSSKQVMDAYIQRISHLPVDQCEEIQLRRVIESLKRWMQRMEKADIHVYSEKDFDKLEAETSIRQ